MPSSGNGMELDVLKWCERLIATRSVTTEGTRQIAELCAQELLGPAGVRANLIPSSLYGAAQTNLLAVIQGRETALAPMGFNTHLDTVPPGDLTLCTKCGGAPFSPKIEGDRIYGLGAADTKLDFVAKSAALLSYRQPVSKTYL